jgi:TRAP-type C4-dicarboxylate transport system substrate-binding protein
MLPPEAQTVMRQAVNQAALNAREDVRALNENLRNEITADGLQFNRTDPKPFREALRQAGFYSDWKARFGDNAWSLLEKSVGALA